METSDLIRSYRKKRGMTQQALADALGVNKSAVGQWEIGLTDPSHENMLRLKGVLGIRETLEFDGSTAFAGEIVDQPEELMLLRYWRSLDLATRHVLMDLLGISKLDSKRDDRTKKKN